MWKTIEAACAVLSISSVGTDPNSGSGTGANAAANPVLMRIAALMLAGTLAACGGGGGSDSKGGTNPPGGGGGPTPPAAGIAITSPAPGAVVAGTNVEIAADVTLSDVVGVQFQSDGINIGAEDLSAPYSVTLDTTLATDGQHTLTAVARDSAGSMHTSAPVTVTVANVTPAPEPPVAGRVEETDPAVVLSGTGWSTASPDWYAWSGGSAMQATTPGAVAKFTFTGTSVAWIGHRSTVSGIANVVIDAGTASVRGPIPVNLFARTVEMNVIVWSVSGLSAGTHTLTITPTGTRDAQADAPGVVTIDAFAVPALPISRLQETDPDVSFTGTWDRADPGFGWSGGGVATVPAAPVGGARVSESTGATSTLRFRGIGVNVIGYRGRDAGKASFSVDGGAATEVDLWSPADKVEAVMFTVSGLPDVAHTITVTVSGTNNGISTGKKVVVDAFDVTTPGRRYQEEDPAVHYDGNWIFQNVNRPWSEGSISEASDPNTSVTFTFTGTSVSWIGCRKLSTGTADITLDGVFIKRVDTYLEPTYLNPGHSYLDQGTEAYQTTIYRVDGLAPGVHTLKIEPSGDGSYTVIDAFDVR